MEVKAAREILAVAPDADPAEVTAAYRRLARRYHPDVDRSRGATERMRLVNLAYECILATTVPPRPPTCDDPGPRSRPVRIPPGALWTEISSRPFESPSFRPGLATLAVAAASILLTRSRDQ